MTWPRQLASSVLRRGGSWPVRGQTCEICGELSGFGQVCLRVIYSPPLSIIPVMFHQYPRLPSNVNRWTGGRNLPILQAQWSLLDMKLLHKFQSLSCYEALCLLFVFLPLQPIVFVSAQPGSGLLSPRFRGFFITHNDMPQSVGLVWTSDQSVAETST